MKRKKGRTGGAELRPTEKQLESPTVNVSPVNVSLPTRRRVHWLREGYPACGGGRHGKKGLWQLELSELTCRRCLKLAANASAQLASIEP